MLATGAEFSPCGTYRYSLERTWDVDLPRCAFVLFNPSTADALEDDPTIRRCIGFADRWGFGSLEIVNLFAFRSTDPKGLGLTTDPIGPMNDHAILRAAMRSKWLVFAYGALAAKHVGRVLRVSDSVKWAPHNLSATVTIGERTKDGFPKHPLYLKADTPPILAFNGDPVPPSAFPTSPREAIP